ncbi:ATP-binding cassette domain-containing protein [Telmatospirillum sp.]|uniref:ATP-binding cassette domain-containing protein n=1 Tax=Telmatospirillum sp. TaxID=2079197 RepID=UPI00283B1EC3|nr:ATP-binding cassette domain-containing protein [Telmatospirillum sp.]MDR3435780.1 ATP-binding cassette domain-containing protein [Telmatospirillum sp.]
MAPPLIALRNGFVTFGGRPLFTGVTLQVGRGEKCCLVGRNGSGKSTLLKVLAGVVHLDSGEHFQQPGVRLAHLDQDPAIDAPSVADWVATGLPEGERDQRYRVDAMLEALKIDGGRSPANLSGGESRRAALARALVGDPDALLLDEPTNHLDLPTIMWLENHLQAFKGALVTVSHDRAFLSAVSRQTLWLDRGVVRRNESGFAGFEAWQEEIYAAEDAEQDRMDKRLAAETHWLHRGVTARRKRNMGRLRALMALRQERSDRIKVQGSVKLDVESGETSGKMVIEAKDITKAFGEQMIVKGFSTRISRGDRVGLIGPNGAGKTTLLSLLTGTLPVDSGSIRLGTNLQIAVYDQRRTQLDPEATVWDTLTDGAGDNISVRGTPRHVMSYLRDFLFEDRQAQSPVKSLSGGERNRLLLAKLLAKPSNLLVLDEPTNDLDMDTLDLLEETLADYDGTLLLVSHDRDFIDRLVTSVIAVEGNGQIDEYVGGYSDYQRWRTAADADSGPAVTRASAKQATVAIAPRPKTATKLTYKEQRELDELPARQESLQTEIANLETSLTDPALYSRDPKRFATVSERLMAARHELAAAEERWLELEMKREELSAGR